MRARKRRAENRSVCGIHEDSSTELTRLSWKKCIFRGALNFFGQFLRNHADISLTRDKSRDLI